MGGSPDIPPELAAEMTPAVRAFFDALIAQQQEQIAALESRVAELEEQLGQSPRNSSLPPSSEHPHARPDAAKKPGKSRRKRGGQPGHGKHSRELLPVGEVDELIPCVPATCGGCGGKLTGSDPEPLRHQVWELPPIKPVVTEYQRHRLTCVCCHRSTCGELPAGISTGTAGPRLTAMAAILLSTFRLSSRQTKVMLESVFGVPASIGWIDKLKVRATEVLRPAYDELREALPDQPRLRIDETPWRQGTHRSWLWAFVAGVFTVFQIAASRKREELTGAIGEDYGGVVISDRATMYEHLATQQYCWAHLKRDFQSIAESRDAQAGEIGEGLLWATEVVFRQFGRHRDGTIGFAGLKSSLGGVRMEVEALLLRGLRCDHAKTSGRCQKLYWNRRCLWTFLEHEGVELTNNAAERAIRGPVIKRKLSFGTQSDAGSRFVETTQTIVETCRQQNRNALDYITEALTAGKAASLLQGV